MHYDNKEDCLMVTWESARVNSFSMMVHGFNDGASSTVSFPAMSTVTTATGAAVATAGAGTRAGSRWSLTVAWGGLSTVASRCLLQENENEKIV